MVRFSSCFWLVIFALTEIGCVDQIAAVDLGPSCQTSADCESDFYCYKTACLPRPRCRVDGLKTDGEECDDGNNVNTDGCTNTCALARCGDGIVRNDLHLEHEQFENCEPEFEDPDLDCGDDCILRPKRRRLFSSNIGSCVLRDDGRMDCWGRFNDYVQDLQDIRDGRTNWYAPVLQWRGTSVQLPITAIGFVNGTRAV